jgi:hypothetical protein
MVRVAFFIVLSLLGASRGLACSCAINTSVCSVYWSTSSLFLGHVVRIEHVYDTPPEEKVVNGKTVTVIGPGQYLVHFDVAKSYRGAAGEQVVVHTPDQGPACGYGFQEGHDYLVYANPARNGDLSTSRCSRTHEVVSRADDSDIQWIETLPKAPPGGYVLGDIRKIQPVEGSGYGTEGLADIAVSVKGPVSKTVSSDAEGKFRADGLAPGQYTVSATPPAGYAPFTSSTVTIQDHGCAELIWRTRLDGHIRGHVFFSDGAPAEGVYLTAKIPDSQPSYVATDSDGSFDFGELAPGSYVLAANMDFSPLTPKGTSYYRRAFYPGVAKASEAAIITVGTGESVGNLRFFLPPDAPPPTIAVDVTVVGFDGNPVPRAAVIAYDDLWENSAMPVVADADDHGKATITLRRGQHYDIEAVETLPDSSQACAEPRRVDPQDKAAPLLLVLSRHIGNCMQFKK